LSVVLIWLKVLPTFGLVDGIVAFLVSVIILVIAAVVFPSKRELNTSGTKEVVRGST
jgi:hypothetical protein